MESYFIMRTVLNWLAEPRHLNRLLAITLRALAALVVRAAGEAIAAFISLVAVGGGIYVWFTGKGVGTILNPPPKFLPLFGDTTFMGGIEFMVGGVLSAILGIVVTYLAAEGLHLLGEAAGRMQASQRAVSEPSEPTLSSEPSLRLRSGTGTCT